MSNRTFTPEQRVSLTLVKKARVTYRIGKMVTGFEDDENRFYPCTNKPLMGYVIAYGDLGKDWLPLVAPTYHNN